MGGPRMQKDQIDLTRFENLDNCKNDLGEMSSETQNKGYSVGTERGAKKKKFAIGGGVAVLAVLVLVGISLSSRGNSETTTLPEISEPSVTEAPAIEVPVAERSEPSEEIIPPEKMEYRHEAKDLSNSQIKYIIYQGDKQLTYYKFLTGLENEKQLRDYFRSILNDVPFDTFKWETPSINANTITRPFEFYHSKLASFEKYS